MKTRLLALVLLLAACVPPEPGAAPPGAPQPGDLIAGSSGDALVEREPDLCHAADYQQYVGQPGTIVTSLGITRTYRVVEFGGIVTQEYNPGRLNFHLSPSGQITVIDCG
jgi:hypothetical protein